MRPDSRADIASANNNVVPRIISQKTGLDRSWVATATARARGPKGALESLQCVAMHKHMATRTQHR